MIFLIDHNLSGHAEILLGTIANQGSDRILLSGWESFKFCDRLLEQLSNTSERDKNLKNSLLFRS
jgi:hypothetical protein